MSVSLEEAVGLLTKWQNAASILRVILNAPPMSLFCKARIVEVSELLGDSGVLLGARITLSWGEESRLQVALLDSSFKTEDTSSLPNALEWTLVPFGNKADFIFDIPTTQ